MDHWTLNGHAQLCKLGAAFPEGDLHEQLWSMHSGQQTPDAAVRGKRAFPLVLCTPSLPVTNRSPLPHQLPAQTLHCVGKSASSHLCDGHHSPVSSWSCSCVRIFIINIIIVQSFNAATNAFTSLSSRSTLLCAASKR